MKRHEFSMRPMRRKMIKKCERINYHVKLPYVVWNGNCSPSIQENFQNFIIIFMRSQYQWCYIRCKHARIHINFLPTLQFSTEWNATIGYEKWKIESVILDDGDIDRMKWIVMTMESTPSTTSLVAISNAFRIHFFFFCFRKDNW